MKTMKKLSVIIRCFLLFMTIMITTGSMNAEAASPKLNVKSKTIYVGRSYQLKVKNTNKKVKWSSSDKAIATVSSKGIVKGKKAGKVTITASVAKKKLTCNVTVKNNVSVNKSTITLKQGKSTKVTVSTKKSVGTIWYNIKDTNVVSCKWGNWKGRKIPLTITAKNPGTTTVTITNAYSKEKVKIKVKVPQVWDSVEVVIPDTIGEQGCEENRMKILDYSFYNPYSWSSSYYMNVKFKMVQYGKTGRSNWGEYVYFYDANGNILDKSHLYAGSLALNKTFTDELMVPKNTAKIEFMEYPSMESDSNTGNSGNTGNTGSTEGGNNSLLWSRSDFEKLKEYADSAYEWASKAKDYVTNKNLLAIARTQGAINTLTYAKAKMQSAYDYAAAKEPANLIDADGNPAGTLQESTQEVLNVFDGLENLTMNDEKPVRTMVYSARTKISQYRYLLSVLILKSM